MSPSSAFTNATRSPVGDQISQFGPPWVVCVQGVVAGWGVSCQGGSSDGAGWPWWAALAASIR